MQILLSYKGYFAYFTMKQFLITLIRYDFIILYSKLPSQFHYVCLAEISWMECYTIDPRLTVHWFSAPILEPNRTNRFQNIRQDECICVCACG